MCESLLRLNYVKLRDQQVVLIVLRFSYLLFGLQTEYSETSNGLGLEPRKWNFHGADTIPHTFVG